MPYYRPRRVACKDYFIVTYAICSLSYISHRIVHLMTLNCIYIFIVTGSFFVPMCHEAGHLCIHSCICVWILFISYLATCFLALIAFLCWCAVKQSINQSSSDVSHRIDQPAPCSRVQRTHSERPWVATIWAYLVFWHEVVLDGIFNSPYSASNLRRVRRFSSPHLPQS